MAFLKNLYLFLASIAICSVNGFHNSAILTDVGEIRNTTNGVWEITCKVLSSQRNVIYNIETQGSEVRYNSTDSYPYYMYINSNDLHYYFSIKKFRSYYQSEPVVFSISHAESNTNITFEIQATNVTLRFKNSTNEYNDFVDHKYVILPLDSKTGFYIQQFKNDMIGLGHTYYGRLITAFVRNATSELQLKIHNQFSAPAEWYLNSTEKAMERIHVDRYNTYCWDSSNKTNNDTGNNNKTVTDFTIMIDTQYKFNQTMMLDLYKLKFLQDNEVTKEYLTEYFSDIKDNYIMSKELHKKILRSNRLSRFEITVKNKYLKNNVFLQIREMYFELVKSIEFNLSKFK
ncbi:uncharacterized protein LOC129609816 [Condylostylus longicornis]|uniref:uncharacterized protein LOC129609816 n=1 Tax=Condylostylus longicornis TaxID=2530218 RepID=UPI00244E079B|nr:uncharacterized protein LOC129609816 [Condylostylus longicornis]